MQNFSALRVSIPSRGVNGWIIRLLGLVVSIALLIFLLWQIDIKEFFAMIQGISVVSLLVAFLIYMLLNFFRAVRFTVLLGGEGLSSLTMYPIALYHNFLTRTLPFKTGELSYIVMIRHYLRKPVVEGVGSLVSARLFDLLCVASGCTIGLLSLAVQSPDHLLITLFVPCLAISALCLYFAAPILRRVMALEHYLLRNRKLSQSKAVTWIDEKMLALIENLGRIRNPRLFITLLALSACIYGASAAFNLVLLHELGITAPFGTQIVIVSIAMFAEALPFSVAGLGLVEGGWTLGLVKFAGLMTSQAASIGLFLHACQLISVAISGLIGYFLLHTPAFHRSTQR